MKALIDEIRNKHTWHPPLADIEQQMNKFEATTGFTLPADLKDFYRQCGKAELFDSSYMILPFKEFQKASMVLVADDTEDWCPSSWYAFCDMNDGNYAGLVWLPWTANQSRYWIWITTMSADAKLSQCPSRNFFSAHSTRPANPPGLVQLLRVTVLYDMRTRRAFIAG